MFTYEITLSPDLQSFCDETLSGARTERMHLREGDLLPGLLEAHFFAQENADGSAWEPLAPLTQMLRYDGSPGQPLIESGQLFNSLLTEVLGGGVTAGWTAEHAGMQQEGFSAPGGKIPLSGTKQEFFEGDATRYPETPHRARPDAPRHLKIRRTTTPAREFAYISERDAETLIQEAWEVLFE